MKLQLVEGMDGNIRIFGRVRCLRRVSPSRSPSLAFLRAAALSHLVIESRA